MSVLLCLDVASVTGVAEAEPGERPILSTQRFARPGDGPFEAFARATKWAAKRATSDPAILACYLEAPIMAKWGKTNARTGDLLRGLRAVLAGVFVARGIPCHDASISTVRLFFIGQGKLPGPRAKQECRRVARALGWDPQNDDESDACAIFAWASSLYDKRIRPPRNREMGADRIIGDAPLFAEVTR